MSLSDKDSAVSLSRFKAAFEDATAKVLDPKRSASGVTLSGSTVFALLDATGHYLTFGASAVRQQALSEIAGWLRREADMARHAQSNAALDSPDKLYRMGQKDGLLLAADAVERAASADTHPKDGDAVAAPLVSGAVDAEGSETPE